MDPVIPPKSNRKEQREYDRALYKLRHLAENGFLDFKQWRGIATRYARACRQITFVHSTMARIWQLARNEAAFLA